MRAARSDWLANLNSPVRVVALACVVATMSYVAPRLLGELMLHPLTVWPFWPGCALLVSVLLLVRQRLWPVLTVAAFAGFVVYDLQAGVSLRSIAWFIPADTVQVMIAAVGLRHFFDGVPRLNSVKHLAQYWLTAVILAPAAAAILSAFGVGTDYWSSWKVSFFSEVLAFVILPPFIFAWITEGSRQWVQKPRVHHLEGASLIGGLIVLAYITFSASGRISPALLY